MIDIHVRSPRLNSLEDQLEVFRLIANADFPSSVNLDGRRSASARSMKSVLLVIACYEKIPLSARAIGDRSGMKNRSSVWVVLHALRELGIIRILNESGKPSGTQPVVLHGQTYRASIFEIDRDALRARQVSTPLAMPIVGNRDPKERRRRAKSGRFPCAAPKGVMG